MFLVPLQYFPYFHTYIVFVKLKGGVKNNLAAILCQLYKIENRVNRLDYKQLKKINLVLTFTI